MSHFPRSRTFPVWCWGIDGGPRLCCPLGHLGPEQGDLEVLQGEGDGCGWSRMGFLEEDRGGASMGSLVVRAGRASIRQPIHSLSRHLLQLPLCPKEPAV